jgi:hypothetical protein
VDLGLVAAGEVSLLRAIAKAHQCQCQHAKGDDHKQDEKGKDPAPQNASAASAFAGLAE